MKARTETLILSTSLLVLCAGPLLGQRTTHVREVSGFDVDVPRSLDDDRAIAIVQYDDGEIDVELGFGSTTHEAAMLFEGVGGEDVTLGSIDFCWLQNFGDPTVRYEVVLWLPDGPGGSPGTEIASFNAVAEGVDSTATFYSTGLGYPLDEEDVYIGVRWYPAVDPAARICIDTDGIDGTFHPGYERPDEADPWFAIEALGGGLSEYKALMLRAVLSTPGVIADRLVVPSFAVDRTTSSGTTTLFAVRNLTDGPLSLDVQYREADGALQMSEIVDLAARDTQTVNIRDVGGLVVGPDDFTRGYLEIFGPGDEDGPLFAGDYLQVDPGDDYATGEQARRRVCSRESIRFFDFGEGTRVAVWIQNPQGSLPGIDPESFTIQVYDENGLPDGGPQPVHTGDHTLELEASDFTSLSFGTLAFDFSNSGGGFAFGEYSASGRFSVGFDSECESF